MMAEQGLKARACGSPAVAHRALHSSEGSGEMERGSPGLRSVARKGRVRVGVGGGMGSLGGAGG